MFLLSCALLEVFTIVIYQQSQVSKNSNDWVIHSYEVLRIGRLSLIDAIDLNNDEQEYMLTGYSSYLEPYKATLVDLNRRLDELSRSTTDNAQQRENIAVLREKIEALKDASSAQIDASRRGKINAYSLKNDKETTRRLIAEVRAAYETFSQSEATLLQERRHHASQEQKNYLWTLIMGAVFGLGALLIANLVIFSVIAKNIRGEEKLRKSEELFSLILNGINDGVYDHNLTAGSIYYSPSYKKMLGYSDDELTAYPEMFYSLMHPDDIDGVREKVRQYRQREISVYSATFRVRHKDGHWAWILSRGIGVWNEEGKMTRMIGTHTDITAQKEREEELGFLMKENERQRSELALEKERAEAASQAKSDFLATMSHEIRTPMNAVIGLSRLLLESTLTDKQQEMTATLHANADILLRLVNDLLDLSRIEAGQIELESRPFTVEGIFKVLHALFNAQANAKGLAFTLTNTFHKQGFIGDATRIQQILVNLVSNALKFTLHGSIHVKADGVIDAQGNANLCFSVTDTGVGIPADKIISVFDKFVQADQTISRRFGGSGLGLAICRSLAHLMGGDVSVVSNVDRGSLFMLNIPVKVDSHAALPVAASTLAATTKQASGTVLVIEDYAANVLVATLMLENMGFTVDIAPSGVEAINKLRARMTPYTAILMDIQMQGMDGYETTRHLRMLEKEKGMHHFIIGVTAHALAGDREKCLHAGMDDYMSKPVHPDLLAQKLHALPKAA